MYSSRINVKGKRIDVNIHDKVLDKMNMVTEIPYKERWVWNLTQIKILNYITKLGDTIFKLHSDSEFAILEPLNNNYILCGIYKSGYSKEIEVYDVKKKLSSEDRAIELNLKTTARV
jgi:hypothetical protein